MGCEGLGDPSLRRGLSRFPLFPRAVCGVEVYPHSEGESVGPGPPALGCAHSGTHTHDTSWVRAWGSTYGFTLCVCWGLQPPTGVRNPQSGAWVCPIRSRSLGWTPQAEDHLKPLLPAPLWGCVYPHAGVSGKGIVHVVGALLSACHPDMQEQTPQLTGILSF